MPSVSITDSRISDSVSPFGSSVMARSVCQATTNRSSPSPNSAVVIWGFSSRLLSEVRRKVRTRSSLWVSSAPYVPSTAGIMATTVSQSVVFSVVELVSRV